MKRSAMSAFLLLAAAGSAAAQGIVIPEDPKIPPLALERHHVRVEIHHPVATTEVEQIFVNHTDRPLEAQYVFPIPPGAAINRFTMLVNGQEKAGDLLEREEARRIYQQIVSRVQDPGLLEYLGGNLFRMSLFPIPAQGRQRITLRFDQVLSSHDGLTTYVYPLPAGPRDAASETGSFSMEIALRCPLPILTLYSPTHPVEIVRSGDREARVAFREPRGPRARSFQLYYSISEKELSFHVLTHRPDPREPGYFLLLIAPRWRAEASRVVERDFIFVLDTSGSMGGPKIQQARNALKHGLRTLGDGDRFAILRFSTGVEAWKREWVGAREGREAALAWIDALCVEGGTNIADALEAALAFPRDPSRPCSVVFLTDGKPTVGSTRDPGEILGRLKRARSGPAGASLRVFTWGVGYDVDTHLLDGMAEIGAGLSEYVRPEEDIEAKVSAFFARTARPVLANLEVGPLGDGVQFVDVYPRTLPDLYAGSTLILAGRYAGAGDTAVRLAGRLNETPLVFDGEASFPAEETRHPFVARVWAMRRVGHLLDTIRRHGESPELLQDVVRLSREYGIPTPYTSALILEDWRGPVTDRSRPAAASVAEEPKGKALVNQIAGGGAPATPEPEQDGRLRREAAEAARALSGGFKEKSGQTAVETAAALLKLKQAESAGEPLGVQAQRAAGTRFLFYRGFWVDERFEAEHAVTRLRFAGASYFRLLEKRPGLAEALRLGTSVIYVTAPGKALVVDPGGAEAIPEEDLDALFRPAPAK
jgi:Ca-activated chloride channel family protein